MSIWAGAIRILNLALYLDISHTFLIVPLLLRELAVLILILTFPNFIDFCSGIKNSVQYGKGLFMTQEEHLCVPKTNLVFKKLQKKLASFLNF